MPQLIPPPAFAGLIPVVLALSLVGGCAAVPADTALAPPIDLAARLPLEAAGFRRGTTLPLGDRTGREVAYATPGRTAAGATVEVFRPNGQPVPEGIDTAVATAAFEQLIGDALQQQPPRQVRERRRFRLPTEGSPLLRCAETEGRYGREQVEGLLCAGAAGGSVLRLRVAMPQRNPPAGDATAFAAAILEAVVGGSGR